MRTPHGFPLMTFIFAISTAVSAALLCYGMGDNAFSLPCVKALWILFFGWSTLSSVTALVLYFLAEFFGLSTGRFFKPGISSPAAIFARIALAPYRWLNWPVLLTLRKKGERPIDVLMPGLAISGRLLPWDKQRIADNNIGAVIDVSGELPETPLIIRNPEIAYLAVPLPDNSGPTVAQMQQCVDFALHHLKREVTVLVHCSFGHGRSAAVCAAIMIATDNADSVETANRLMKAARPSVSMSRHQRASVSLWQQSIDK